MSKTTRRNLSFDDLEGKVLLSAGMADPAAAVHRATTHGLSLKGMLTGAPSPAGPVVNSFAIKGNAVAMGRVKGTLTLAIPLTSGHSPNLSGATLTLRNSLGSVQLTIGKSTVKYYNYLITSGSGSFASASGSGLITLYFSQKRFNTVLLVVHSRPY